MREIICKLSQYNKYKWGTQFSLNIRKDSCMKRTDLSLESNRGKIKFLILEAEIM
jgi:hypothetical protein